MSDRLPTVEIKSDHPRGYRIINESDFDPKQHTLYGEKAAAKKLAPKPAEKTDHQKDQDDLPALRAKYEKVVGKKPFMGWKAPELREKIAEAQG